MHNSAAPVRLHLHIGAHKTATTALQRAFAQHRDVLQQAGLLYPQSNRYHFAQHRLAFALRGQRDPGRGDTPDLATELAELQAEISKADARNVLASSEAFMALRKRHLQDLRAGLQGYDLRIIAVVRRQDDYLLSQYNQNAKGVGNGFKRALSEFVADPRSLGREISFDRCITQWEDVFGHDAVTLWRYEDGDIIARMLDHLGLPADLIPAQPHVNTSVPARVADLMRLSKRLNLPVAAQRTVLRVASRTFANAPRQSLTAEQRQAILKVFAQENDALFARFGMTNTYNTP